MTRRRQARMLRLTAAAAREVARADRRGTVAAGAL